MKRILALLAFKAAVLPILFSVVTPSAARANTCHSLFVNSHNETEVSAKRSELELLARKSWRRITVQELAKLNVKIDDLALSALGIPESVFEYYSRTTGKFSYKRQRPLQLSLENGDQPLRAIRLNFATDSYFKELILDYQAVIEKLPELELWVAHTEKSLPELLSLLDQLPNKLKSRVRLISFSSEGQASLWSQDISKPTEGSGTLMKGWMPDGFYHEKNMKRDYSVQSTLAAHNAGFISATASNFIFDGGNVIVGSRHVFTGQMSVSQSAQALHISEAEAKRALSIEFGKDLIVLSQIDFHIDLSMAVARNRLTQKETILLSSPKVALEVILGKRLEPFRLSYEDMFKFYGALIKAHPHLKSSLDRALRNSAKNSFQGDLAWSEILSQEDYVKKAEDNFRNAGYDVILVPGVNEAVLNPIFGRLGTQFPSYFNYTNSIFSRDIAIVPQNDVPALDNYFFSIMKDLGYDAIPMPSSKKLFCLSGGVRCAAETFRQ